MSYPDPPPPPYPFMSQPYSDDNAGGFWPQFQMNSEYLDSYSQFEQPPPFKRPTNSENNPTNCVPLAPSNPQMNPTIPLVNRGTTHIFFKTRMCTKFMDGDCKNGDSCNFAHGPEDLREPPPNWQELVKDRGAGNWNGDQKVIHTMKICKKFYNGEVCPYGKWCNFRHESPAKFRTDMAGEMAMARTRYRSVHDRYDLNKHLYSNSDVIQVKVNANSDVIQVNANANSDSLGVNENVNSDVSRVNMNANFDVSRATMKSAYWKTKICSKWEVGVCPFGERCHFAHGESDLQVPNGRTDQLREFMMNGRADPREVMMNAAGGSIVAYPSAVVTISDVPPTTISTVAAAPINESGEAKKGFAKWGPNKKINRIYGDWIDDLSPPRDSSSQVEN